jgi:DNA-directed RNA polymerase specialized sigma24 family protein
MDLLARAQAGDGEAFGQLVDPYRRELQVHCYRILGSVQDAEDALQDTLLSAWQGLAGFEGRFGPDLAVPRRHQPLPGRAAVG